MSADVNKEYLLTIRIKFSAFDDAEARKIANSNLLDFGISVEAAKEHVKFQRLKKDGAPEKVEL